MRRTILIVPGLLSEPDGDSFLRQKLPAIAALTDRGTLSKVAAAPRSETPEAMLLGIGPDTVRLAQGPLTVSALGFDPPERSTHFHLSLVSFTDGIVTIPNAPPSPKEAELLLDAAKRLNTKRLTTLKGEELDHGLVWEGLGDLGTTSASDANGKLIREIQPDGDGDVALRRLIDDSINLFSNLELNERRLDEGLAPFNLLWPWGQGVRTKVPNLALRRGEPLTVESASMRLAGLTRLAGYSHIDRQLVGKALKTHLRPISQRAMARTVSIIYLDVVEQLRRGGSPEEIDWFVRELDRELMEPLLEDHRKTPSRLILISPASLGAGVGLSVSSEHGVPSDNQLPFDERSLEEKRVPSADLWTLVEQALD